VSGKVKSGLGEVEKGEGSEKKSKKGTKRIFSQSASVRVFEKFRERQPRPL